MAVAVNTASTRSRSSLVAALVAVERTSRGARRARRGGRCGRVLATQHRLTPRRTVQALYRQSSLSGSRYRARWRHESRIFVIPRKFSGIRSHCTLPSLYPPITDGPNIGVMSGRQCVAGHGHDPDGAEKAWRPRCGRRRGRAGRPRPRPLQWGSGRVGSVCVAVAVAVTKGGGRSL